MKKIIQYLLQQDKFTANIHDSANHLNISVDNLKLICSKYPETFVIEDNKLKYLPPFGIVNRETFKLAVNKAFPKGIPYDKLKLCYEFVESDFNEMKYNNELIIISYGKAKKDVIFKNYEMPQENISSLWEEYLLK